MDSKTSGVFRNVQIPRSSIYVSATADQQETQKKKYKFESAAASFHFFLILKVGENYVQNEEQDDIQRCNGKFHCYNCHRPILGAMHFYPEQFHFQTHEPTCNPIPHCRPECVFRTIQDMPNHDDLLNNFFLLYGHDFICAPPRCLLYVPGGLSLDQYHKSIDDQLAIQMQDTLVRGVLAPVYVSCTLFQEHQLVPDTVALLEELQMETRTTIGPSRNRDNSELSVVALKPEKLTQSAIGQVFQFDTASFRPGEEHL